MDKPQRKSDIAVSYYDGSDKRIRFWCTKELVKQINPYGRLLNYGSNEYVLHVDARYDFTEVLKYIISLGIG